MSNKPIEQAAVQQLHGVGPQLAARLEKLGILCVQDLLFLLPLRYEDRTRIVPIGSLRPGQRAVVEGEIQLTEVAYRGRRNLLCKINDGTGGLTLRFFHFSRAQQNGLARGKRIRCFGEARPGTGGLQMVHPEYRFPTDTDLAADDTLTPVYPATEGLQQGRLRNLTRQALGLVSADGLDEWLPDRILKAMGFPGLLEAVTLLHRPPADTDLKAIQEGRHPAQRRMAFEELLAQHLSLRKLRSKTRDEPAVALVDTAGAVPDFIGSLPYALTGAQQRVIAELLEDLAEEQPMMRLVQGDVGSGKTVVAAAATVCAAACNRQTAIMAPTELLAEQHAENFRQWFEPLGQEVALLTGKITGKARQQLLQRIADGRARIVVGTHALFQESVTFDHLALVVVDEQHRFGVHQRLALREKGDREGRCPHQLIMTATPIPRTLAMTAYADLDVSVIDELPPGRKPVTTVAMPESRRHELVTSIRDACLAGQQAYWVCPLIEESEVLDYEAAEKTANMLAEALPELSLGLVHGRMKSKDKHRVMQAFKSGEIDLLIATTVVEVGVDVPNASMMIIENAERMGLAQLHQLRGRVGRGGEQSSCLLLYKPPLSDLAKQRLAVLRETNDGFKVAQADLDLRGPGELLGIKQTGLMQMRIADLMRDADLLPEVHKTATFMLKERPDAVAGLIERWIGEAGRFGKV
ncbi:MAG: ATP-dependent DNA helicase RecG [Gammaproteobacteria bacterium]|nr:ATP-dependent DNA helicase RecG [Gammaproteobacteria bacterium]